MRMKYKVVFERRETMREIFEVEADNKEDAEDKATELCDNHDWTENSIIHGDESIVSCLPLDPYARVYNNPSNPGNYALILYNTPVKPPILTLHIGTDKDDTWVEYEGWDLHVHEGEVFVYKLNQYQEAVYQIPIIK